MAGARLDRPAACVNHSLDADLCGRCPVVDECLAALTTDDRAEWRGA